jgi:hypothetical protein
VVRDEVCDALERRVVHYAEVCGNLTPIVHLQSARETSAWDWNLVHTGQAHNLMPSALTGATPVRPSARQR